MRFIEGKMRLFVINNLVGGVNNLEFVPNNPESVANNLWSGTKNLVGQPFNLEVGINNLESETGHLDREKNNLEAGAENLGSGRQNLTVLKASYPEASDHFAGKAQTPPKLTPNRTIGLCRQINQIRPPGGKQFFEKKSALKTR